VRNFLTFIRFSHTIFALPFALGSMFVAADGLPSLRVFLLIVLAMVFARTAAMTFNRIVDWEIDKRNPRTEGRHRLVSRPTAIAACVIASLLFVLTAVWINPLCGYLSPVALAIVFFYSLTKRFTHFAQFFLGLALAVAPVGAWLAVTGTFASPPIILALGVLLWVAGFDMIYATQDVEVDRREGLKSMVVLLGEKRALLAAMLLHLAMFGCLIAFGTVAQLGSIFFGSLAIVGLILIYEHLAARSGSAAAIQKAFFYSNALVGLIFTVATLLDRMLPKISI